MLRPLGIQSIGEALPVLARGFPGIAKSSWAAALRRLSGYRHAGPVGYLLQAAGRDVGAILAIPSERRNADGSVRRVVNLSSWYVDEEHRWRAPRMLQQIVGDAGALYTDLTPTAPVQAMIGRFGFEAWTEGALLFPLPWFACRPAGGARFLPLHRLPHNALPPAIRGVMEEHAAWGCIGGALSVDGRLHPLIFSRTSRKGVPIARLIYAESRSLVTARIAAVARFLLRERVAVLAINADRRERVPGSIFTRRAPPTFFKGAMSGAQVDHTYSEFVFLQF